MKWYDESNFNAREGRVFVLHYSKKYNKLVISQDILDKEKRDTVARYDITKQYVKEGKWYAKDLSTPWVWAFHFSRVDWKNAKAWVYEEDLIDDYYTLNELPVECDLTEVNASAHENVNLSDILVNNLR